MAVPFLSDPSSGPGWRWPSSKFLSLSAQAYSIRISGHGKRTDDAHLRERLAVCASALVATRQHAAMTMILMAMDGSSRWHRTLT
jgi:hypothetical protein